MLQSTVCIAHSQEVYACGLTQVLQSENFQISSNFNCGVATLQFILEHAPMVAILDVSLPQLSAFDIIRTCSERKIATKFIVIFPDAEHEYLVNSRSLGIAGILHARDSLQTVKECLLHLL
jgi:DNA-binding NarL/FixJ family response regulator